MNYWLFRPEYLTVLNTSFLKNERNETITSKKNNQWYLLPTVKFELSSKTRKKEQQISNTELDSFPLLRDF